MNKKIKMTILLLIQGFLCASDNSHISCSSEKSSVSVSVPDEKLRFLTGFFDFMKEKDTDEWNENEQSSLKVLENVQKRKKKQRTPVKGLFNNEQDISDNKNKV